MCCGASRERRPPVVNAELGRIQKLLREEVLKLRELMQAMKSFEVGCGPASRFISDTVERFRRETGIAAEFVSELERVDLAQKGCRELARIVQESLVNVRKHSGAHHVLVRFGAAFGQFAIDGGRRWQRVSLFRPAFACRTGIVRQRTGGNPGKSALAGGRNSR